ncbi:MAG: DUF4355 domain-containing protein [Schleiferilactobacillus perolens]|uniref:DUF4355 domain-containing protein n=1 Tax=Schleiferilactobacillus perolens TaxID=100468 RepID=UPI0039E99B07
MKNTDLLKMSLQYFAEDTGDDDQSQNSNKDESSNENNKGDNEGATDNHSESDGPKDDSNGENPKKYTDDQVDEIVKRRLARAEKDKQAAVDEAQKLAKMNADQKKDYELDKAKKEAAALKEKLATYDMAKQARSMFEDAKAQVSQDDLDHVVTPEAESTEANVKWLIAHDQAVTERVRQEYLKGNTPKANGGHQEISGGVAFAQERNKQAQTVNDPWKQK